MPFPDVEYDDDNHPIVKAEIINNPVETNNNNAAIAFIDATNIEYTRREMPEALVEEMNQIIDTLSRDKAIYLFTCMWTPTIRERSQKKIDFLNLLQMHFEKKISATENFSIDACLDRIVQDGLGRFNKKKMLAHPQIGPFITHLKAAIMPNVIQNNRI